jgi:hypothetical protein
VDNREKCAIISTSRDKLYGLLSDSPDNLEDFMDRSRYAARLGPAHPSVPEYILKTQEEADRALRAPARFAPASVGFAALPFEPEDARLTGGTRSLSRRLLGLNLTGKGYPPARQNDISAA